MWSLRFVYSVLPRRLHENIKEDLAEAREHRCLWMAVSDGKRPSPWRYLQCHAGGEYFRLEHPSSPVVAQVFKFMLIFTELLSLSQLQHSLLGSLGKYCHKFLALKEHKYRKYMPISGSVGMAKGFLIALSWSFSSHATMRAELITGLGEFKCPWFRRHAHQVFKSY